MRDLDIRANRHWGLPCLIALICFVITLWGENGRESLAYTYDFVARAELWRGVTGHITHIGWPHFFLNILGLFGVWGLYGKTFRPMIWAVIFLLCGFGISAGFYIFDGDLQSYVGLSGVLHGLLAAGALASLFRSVKTRQGWPFEDIFVFIALWLKVAYEQFAGPVPLTEAMSGGTVVINAHLYGAVIGTIIGGIALFFIRNRMPFARRTR